MRKSLLLFIGILYGLSFCLPLYSQVEIKSFTDGLSPFLNGQEVIFSCPLTVTKTYYSSPSGDIILSPDLLYSPTEVALPGIETNNLATQNNQRKLTLKSSAFTYTDSNHTLRTGSKVTGLRGTLYYSNGTYSLTPTVQPVFSGNERTLSPESVGACNLKVASFNVEYYIADSLMWNLKYGAANRKEFTHQRAKILAALKGLDADIYALCEVGEGNTSVTDLVNGLNEVTSSNNYAYVADNDYSESTYTKNVFIYNKTRVTPYSSLYKFGIKGFQLRQIAQAFDLNSNGERVIITVNHLKAKSDSGSGNNADTGDGQGSFNYQRITQAQLVVNTLNKLTTYYGDPDVLVVGDMNSYSMEDPIKVYTGGGLVNQLKRYSPSDYSYVYSGNVGYLDHSLATSTLSSQVTGARPWHINADEPSYFGYEYSTYYSADPYRCSDHDPIVTGLNLGANGTGLGYAEAKDADKLQVFGESSQGYLTLCAGQIDRVELLSASGQLIFSARNATSGEYFLLPTNALLKGFYLIRAFSGKKVLTSKLLIS
ncbi:ExeM/NucH family extracellular endonuclease [uncultured Bacteroides sp.]|uniref:ExeM/NucH family extracellular endonuclease n=1 Tax=uncultured Bacteroides sp. TaxID=162156 RepID=UPI002AAAC712|nr:ExeM/NucH family extracellular endonuclease [uncultured Bacteroides sp.]